MALNAKDLPLRKKLKPTREERQLSQGHTFESEAAQQQRAEEEGEGRVREGTRMWNHAEHAKLDDDSVVHALVTRRVTWRSRRRVPVASRARGRGE